MFLSLCFDSFILDNTYLGEIKGQFKIKIFPKLLGKFAVTNKQLKVALKVLSIYSGFELTYCDLGNSIHF